MPRVEYTKTFQLIISWDHCLFYKLCEHTERIKTKFYGQCIVPISVIAPFETCTFYKKLLRLKFCLNNCEIFHEVNQWFKNLCSANYLLVNIILKLIMCVTKILIPKHQKSCILVPRAFGSKRSHGVWSLISEEVCMLNYPLINTKTKRRIHERTKKKIKNKSKL
jgi:hypothetical protein